VESPAELADGKGRAWLKEITDARITARKILPFAILKRIYLSSTKLCTESTGYMELVTKEKEMFHVTR
jgi:hypothetical protein